MTQHVQCTTTGSVLNSDGLPVRLRAGTVYRADDEIVLLHPKLFASLEPSPVEQATKNPGQKRATKRPAKKA